LADTFKTRDQLIERAGIALGLVQPGEALSSEDHDTLDNLFDPLISQLSSDSVIYIGDPDQIELDVFIPLAACLANQAGPSFGGAFNDQAWARDTATLRRVSWAAPTYEPLKSETF